MRWLFGGILMKTSLLPVSSFAVFSFDSHPLPPLSWEYLDFDEAVQKQIDQISMS